jgi:predicted amidohydrolase
MLLGYCQFHVQFGEPAANAAVIDREVRRFCGPGLLVLPELALSGYDFPSREVLADAAEPGESGPTAQLLRGLARETGLTLATGYAERDGDRLYNSAMLVEPDGTWHNYRKLHLFNRETTLFEPGNITPRAMETALGPVGLMVCFDWFFPEVARCLALDGALVIAHPSNLVLPWCQRAMLTRSLENRVYTVTANRIGTETQAGRSLTFTGASQVLSPTGDTLAEAPVDAPHTAMVEVDLGAAANKQLNEYNHLFNARRTEHFGALNAITQVESFQ